MDRCDCVRFRFPLQGGKREAVAVTAVTASRKQSGSGGKQS